MKGNSKTKSQLDKSSILRIAVITLLLCTVTNLAFAHNVTIFAWTEGDMVHTESKFARGRKAKNAPVEVYDATGKKLLQGKTDENGEFSFKAPVKADLTIVLIAGMGHKAEWTITASELTGTEKNASLTEINEIIEAQRNDNFKKNLSAQEVNPGDIELALEKVLDKKLQPVLKMLIDLHEKKPTLHDIFSGIGYIFGLMGIAAYMKYRRKT